MIGQEVRLERITMRFGDFTAVQPTDLVIPGGEFFSILGPSGCGKTTLLRLISGFEMPSGGKVLIGGRDMAGIGPNGRPTALIFQNLALFPLMSVRENVAFGLEARGIGRTARTKRADELLALVALDGQGDKKPSSLSGGQRQRVAIARALAVEPGVLLLDEPLSALDLKLRQLMRAELRAIQKRTGVTFIYITHDQGEALTMSDRVAVMNKGRIEQIGSPAEIYAEPASYFAATFVGEQNILAGKVASVAGGSVTVETSLGIVEGIGNGLRPGDTAHVCIRPERVVLGHGNPNRFCATVLEHAIEGPFVITKLQVGSETWALNTPNVGVLQPQGAVLAISVSREDARVFGAGDTLSSGGTSP
jgi:spermidine/putrescine transport system ATP-binding protein